ncbi:hypothetical protein H8699_03855 [Christensenellaceae bacterium NSJ-44]|uniref:Uncharacterized protein n=1 Tax=Luoshenia tenuis TaxID=2763654 RepID=A0A926HIA2_9FIRM|nr:hypothetical protein [Luoshenia tenuis]MBC8528572.1 hypothetical protein [Luoshenia tenuis]
MHEILRLLEVRDSNYEEFINYALNNSDYFMLVYVRYNMAPESIFTNNIFKDLRDLTVKTRANPSWAGTPETYSNNTAYKITFYRSDPSAQQVLNRVNGIYNWTRPENPQDLAFYRGGQCWFYSIGHERMSGIIDPSPEDKTFFEERSLIDSLFRVDHALDGQFIEEGLSS